MNSMFNKELLCWYLITLKLKEAVESHLPESGAMNSMFNKELYVYKSLRCPKSDPKFKHHPPRAFSPLQLSPRSPDSAWIITIHKKLKQAQQYVASSPMETIHRVPKSLRNVDVTAYTPQIVSLGPYHRGRRHLRDMDHHKWRILYRALDRTGHDVRHYLDAVLSLEDRARACYEAPLRISPNAFIESLVLDSIFTLELLRGAAGEGFRSLGYAPNDPIFASRNTISSLQLDMIKLENQLPLFVLDRILALQLGREPSCSSFLAFLAICFFRDLRPLPSDLQSAKFFDPLSDAGNSKPLHLLDVFHRSLVAAPRNRLRPIPSAKSIDPLSNAGSSKTLHCLDVFHRSLVAAPWNFRRPHAWPIANKTANQLCVAKLHDHGIKFQCRKSNWFWDIKFKDGVLQIPHLHIQDCTKSLFLNLIAFEQCYMKCGNHITSYVSFMDDLINSEVDVGYLHDKKIIDNWLGNDGEVANMFNQLAKEVMVDVNENYLSVLSKEVFRYCDHRRNAWRASLKHKYFSNPWAIISLVAAAILLLLTFLQTFYSVYGYHMPN